MSTALSEMYQYTMGELPGCSKIQIMRNVVYVIREWCRITQNWEHDLNAIDIEADVATYEMDSPIEDTEVNALVSRPGDDVGVKVDDRLLSPGVEYTISLEKDTITLYNTPTVASSGGLTIPVALSLVIDADEDTEIPDRVFTDNQHVWAYGVMSRLMLMRKKSWTDRETGALYRNEYRNGINLAITERTRGRTNRSLRIAHPLSFA